MRKTISKVVWITIDRLASKVEQVVPKYRIAEAEIAATAIPRVHIVRAQLAKRQHNLSPLSGDDNGLICV